MKELKKRGLLEFLDGAKYVKTSQKYGIIFAWWGGKEVGRYLIDSVVGVDMDMGGGKIIGKYDIKGDEPTIEEIDYFMEQNLHYSEIELEFFRQNQHGIHEKQENFRWVR